MIRKWTALGVGVCALTMVASQGLATNITVWDGINGNVFDTPTDAAEEVNEVEPGAQTGAIWDLQAFVLADDGTLGIESTFDMATGVAGSFTAPMGDIFVRIGDHVDAVAGTFDYVIDVNWGVGPVGYMVYAATDPNLALDYTGDPGSIVPGAAVLTGWLWRVEPPTVLSQNPGPTGLFKGSQTATYTEGDPDVLAGINLASWLTTQDDVYFYATMGCGNDVLRGHIPGTTVADGGVTLILLGMSLAGIAGLRRRRG